MSESNKIYIDIQSLLDLRQGLLFQSIEEDESELLIEFLMSEEYNYRTTDNFSIVSYEKYQASLKRLSKDTITASTLTHLINLVKNKIVSMEKITSTFTENKKVEVILNVYPISLTDKEIEHITNLLFVKLDTSCLISISNIEPEKLSPNYIKQNGIAAFFIYDFSTWVNLHHKQLETVDIKDVTVYFPALQEMEASKEDLKTIKEVGFSDMFSYTEFLLSRFLNVSFLPIVFYSNLITTAVYLKDLNDGLKSKTLDEVDISHLDIPDI